MYRSTPNQDNPIMQERVFRLWESMSGNTHTTRNMALAGADYISSWWNVVDWSIVSGELSERTMKHSKRVKINRFISVISLYASVWQTT